MWSINFATNGHWLRRFIGHEERVESIDVENKMIAVVFNPAKMREERLDQLTKDSLEKLGGSRAWIS